jgi:glycosyltransferase involved in cell wall biosynthesis
VTTPLLAQPAPVTRREPGPKLASVSVIVPCYNYGHLLEGCLESVLSQEGVDVRLLVIDDCSTDDSAGVGRRLAARDERVEFRPHVENRGLIATANEGLEWATGEYVVLLSADDLLVPGSLRRAVDIMVKHPNVGMVYGKTLLAQEGRPLPTPSGSWRSTKVWSGADWLRIRCRSTYNCISSPEVVVRGTVQRAVGGYDPACHHASDLNMWLRIAAVADIAYVRGVPQAIYRVHSDSMLRSSTNTMVDLCERRVAFDSFFAACPTYRRSNRLWPTRLWSDQLWSGRLWPARPRSGRLWSARLRADQPQTDQRWSARLQTTVARTLARQALWRASRAVDRGAADGDGVVEELKGFALDVYPDAPRLREWRGLRLRQWIGAGRSLGFPPFIATGAAHRLRSHAIRMRWRLRGI